MRERGRKQNFKEKQRLRSILMQKHSSHISDDAISPANHRVARPAATVHMRWEIDEDSSSYLAERDTDSPSDAEPAVQRDATRATTSSCCMSEPVCVCRTRRGKELGTTTCYLPVFLQGVSYLSITGTPAGETGPAPFWPSPLIELR